MSRGVVPQLVSNMESIYDYKFGLEGYLLKVFGYSAWRKRFSEAARRVPND